MITCGLVKQISGDQCIKNWKGEKGEKKHYATCQLIIGKIDKFTYGSIYQKSIKRVSYSLLKNWLLIQSVKHLVNF